MKNILLLGLLSLGWAVGAAGTDGSSVASTSSGSASGSNMWGLIARGGWMLETPDRAVQRRWNHQVGESYKYAVGGRVSFPPDWQVRFLGGAEYQYITSREELSGSGKASIDVTISQFVFYGGAEYMPPWAEGFGVNVTGGLVLGARKSSQLDSGGFTQDLKDESPYGSADWPVVFSLSVFYEWRNLRPILMYESDSALTLGVPMCFEGLIEARRWLKNVVAVVFLGVTLLSVLATSSPSDHAYPDTGTHYIISDCVNPTTASVVVISGGIIISPGGLAFSDFGLPAGLLGQTMTGIVGLASRECTVTYGESGSNHVENRWLYSCYDNGSYKCSVYIEQR